jgi:hypothetical protein
VSTAVKFNCLVCSRSFRASQARADKGVCPDCEASQRDTISSPQSVARSDRPELAPLYGSLYAVMSWIIILAYGLLVLSVMPLAIGLANFFSHSTVPLAAVISFCSLLVSAVWLWVIGSLGRVFIDMANNVARITDVAVGGK